MAPVTNGHLRSRTALWISFVAFCAGSMAYPALDLIPFATVGGLTIYYYEAALVGAFAFGAWTLLRWATASEPSTTRGVSRLLLAYLCYEVLVVIPVALWLGTGTPFAILRTMAVRFTWLLLPVVYALCRDERTRRLAGAIPVFAAVCLAVWGLFVLASNGGGYYVEAGEVRFRALFGGATLFFAWPLVLAAAGAVSRRWQLPLAGVALLGLALTNHRSGWIALAIGGAVSLAWSGRVRKVFDWLVPIAVVGGAIALVWGAEIGRLFEYTVTRLLDFTSGNGADRLLRWRSAWDFFLARPFSDFAWSWRYVIVDRNPAAPHNMPLEIAVTEGIVGLVFYATLLGTAFRRAHARVKSDDEARALLGYLVTFLVFLLANANMYLNSSFALMVGVVAAIVAKADVLEEAERNGAQEDEDEDEDEASAYLAASQWSPRGAGGSPVRAAD